VIALQAVFAVVALVMLARHVPVLFRRPGGSPAPSGARVVAALNVVLALVILGVAVKALLRGLI
jgi:hypothetical protein